MHPRHEPIDDCGDSHSNQYREYRLESSGLEDREDLPAVKPDQRRENAEPNHAKAGEHDEEARRAH